MDWSLDKGRPLCEQICEQLCMRIASGEFAAGERLLSVRDVAVAAGVNPNTVQRAFENLERQGVLYSVRGSGWFVSEDISAARDALCVIYLEKMAAYFLQMRTLGMSDADIKKYVEEWNE